MERTEELFEKIEKYLNNTLSSQDYEDFEKEMTIDQELKTEVEKHRELHRILGDKDTLEFKRKLKKIGEELRDNKEKKSIKGFYYRIAALLIVVLGVGGILWNYITAPSDVDEIYVAYYEPYPVEDVTRGKTKNELEEVLKNYEKGAYLKIIPELEKMKELTNKEQLFLYLGNCYLNIDNAKKAIHQFKNISDTSIYYENAIWYQGLGYLKLNRLDSTKILLQKIINYNGIYKKQAQEMLKVLPK